MKRKLLLLLGLFVVLVSTSNAQSKTFPPDPNGTVRLGGLEAGLARYLESDDDVTPPELRHPRTVETKSSGVKASVIVNTMSLERVAFQNLNQKRLENGQKPLKWSDGLAAVARIHSQNMAEFSFFSHRGLDGKMVSDRADASGVGRWRSIGENIAFDRGYKDPVARAVELWCDSPAHRHNLLDSNWTDSAVGIAVASDGSYYFTQVFLLRK